MKDIKALSDQVRQAAYDSRRDRKEDTAPNQMLNYGY
jgi:hypothetical protein